MRWSKLKHRIEENFAGKLKSHISIHSAAYGNCSCGHAWLTLDGDILANFCTRAYYNRYIYGDRDSENGLGPEQEKKYNNQFVEYGELSRQDVYGACWDYIHELKFDDALLSDNPLVQSLAVLDKRLGKRRYKTVIESDLHPLARKLFDARVSIEQTL